MDISINTPIKITMIKYAIRLRWLGKDRKWHQKTTKYHELSSDAWDEAERIEQHIDYLEMSRRLVRKEFKL